MSDKISLEKLLPIALELYKSVPSVSITFKPTTPQERNQCVRDAAENFATFCHHLRKKLEAASE